MPALIVCGVLMSSCTPRQSLDTVYAQADALKNAGNLRSAVAETEVGLGASPPASPQYWKFYLLKTELTQKLSGGRAALDLLAKEAPNGREFASLNARRKMDEGLAYLTLSQFESAQKPLEDAYRFATIASDEYYLSTIETLRAQVLIHSQHPDAADIHLREGARHATLSKNKGREAFNLQAVAQLAILQSRFEDAIRAIESELELLNPNVNSASMAAALIDLGTCHYRLGRLDLALEAYEKAERLAKDASNHQIALGSVGLVHLDRREYDEARKCFRQALDESIKLGSKSTSASWMSNLAQVEIETKNWSEAAAYNVQALNLRRELKVTTAELYSLVNSASILQGEGKTEEAEKVYTQVTQRTSLDALPALEAHSGLAQLYATAGKDAKADREFGAALKVVERTRSSLQKDQSKMDFLSKMMVMHDNYVDFLMSRGRTERALEVAEASRAMILQERLGGPARVSPNVNAAAYRRLAQESGAILVSYFLGTSRSYVWITTPNQIISYPLPSEETLKTHVENYRALIENLRDPLDIEDSTGRELYRLLLEPIAARLPTGANVIIVPDGALNALNFETIPVPSPRPHYFLEDATVSVVPSLNLLVNTRFHDASAGKLLLIGDPEQVEEKYEKLPFAKDEISAVESHFRPDRVLSFHQRSAEPAAYLDATRGAFSFVHFTAHASADLINPLNSAIILSGKSGANELTAREVLSRPIDAGLVTISACRGAGSKTYAGEGLVGFMWAFFHAGAHGIIAGLWDVSDESTPHLMDQLYAGLMRTEAPAQALRNAKLDLIKSSDVYKLPYYWGPFQLYVRDVAYANDVARLRSVSGSGPTGHRVQQNANGSI